MRRAFSTCLGSLLLLLAGVFSTCPVANGEPVALPSTFASASVVPDENAALRYVSAAAHLATTPVGFLPEVTAWAEGTATGTLATPAVEFACRQERSRVFLLLGDRKGTCTFTPDNTGVDMYEMPPCAALENLADTQVAAALHLPALSPASAAALLNAAFTLGDRLAHHGVLVSRMTGTRIRGLALHGMRHLLQRPQTTASAAALIAERLAKVVSPRREVQEQVRLDTAYLSAMLAAGRSRPDLLVKFGFERHPAVLALPSIIKLLERGATASELAAGLVADPIWPTWTAGLEEYLARAGAIDPLSPTAATEFGTLVSGPAALENPLIGCLCWDFSWVHQKLSGLEQGLSETLELATRLSRTP